MLQMSGSLSMINYEVSSGGREFIFINNNINTNVSNELDDSN